jgi:hypothetical protein
MSHSCRHIQHGTRGTAGGAVRGSPCGVAQARATRIRDVHSRGPAWASRDVHSSGLGAAPYCSAAEWGEGRCLASPQSSRLQQCIGYCHRSSLIMMCQTSPAPMIARWVDVCDVGWWRRRLPQGWAGPYGVSLLGAVRQAQRLLHWFGGLSGVTTCRPSGLFSALVSHICFLQSSLWA